MSGAAPGPDGDRGRDLVEAERWFYAHGLPWFVEGVDDRVAAWLTWRRLLPAVLVCCALGAAAGVAVGAVVDDGGQGALTAGLAVLALLLLYAAGPLRVVVVARWALHRVVGQLGLLLPLVTRALPLLLLFMTFLFINTEVWQVAGFLDRPVLYAVVLLFAGVGIAFLLTRLPEEVRAVERAVADEGVRRACAGTPLEGCAATWTPDGVDDRLSGYQRANLLLVLLVTQALQVLLLALAVLGFFLVFGLLAIGPDVTEAWLGRPARPLSWDWIGLRLPVSNELYQVAVFLSAFAGLYFTVYAVSDANYREQFFSELSRELEQAVGVRAVYRGLLRRTPSAGTGHAPDTDGDAAARHDRC